MSMIDISDDLKEKLKTDLPEWKLSTNGINRWISREVSTELGGIVSKIWDLAEEANHHPDIILGYKGISVDLLTHDKNAITIKDIDLANKIEILILSLNVRVYCETIEVFAIQTNSTARIVTGLSFLGHRMDFTTIF